ncbi:alpha/beta hydrolase-fold protein [Reichenbachiella sp.]|uniref:alpha/beta hydrolase n=1 Tax=Reichenbachiella sp. TaxID=2184521 RepID=UPI0032988264
MRLLIGFLFVVSTFSCQANGVEEFIIKSKILGYQVRYWVHVPDGTAQALPVLYLTDGKWYKDEGEMIKTSESLIKKNKVAPHILVFVDAFNPDNPSQNRRNQQFLCNPKYVKFYRNELIPEIDKKFPTDKSRATRGILGLSFGGLNSMYFALHASDVFGKVGIQSPAPHPCPDIYDDFTKADQLPVDIFLSTGTVNDKAGATRRLKAILDRKGYQLEYVEVPEGHNWRNWKPMLDDILVYFYGT